MKCDWVHTVVKKKLCFLYNIISSFKDCCGPEAISSSTRKKQATLREGYNKLAVAQGLRPLGFHVILFYVQSYIGISRKLIEVNIIQVSKVY